MNPGAYTRAVYAMERQPPFVGEPEFRIRHLQLFAKMVWRSVDRSGREAPTVRTGRGVRHGAVLVSAYFPDEHDIVLARHQRKRSVVLHELAHALVGVEYGHGPTFIKQYIELLHVYFTNTVKDGTLLLNQQTAERFTASYRLK